MSVRRPLPLVLAALLCAAAAHAQEAPVPERSPAHPPEQAHETPVPEPNPLAQRFEDAFAIAPTPDAEAILRHISRTPPPPPAVALSYAADRPAAGPAPEAVIGPAAALPLDIPIPHEKPVGVAKPARDEPADPAEPNAAAVDGPAAPAAPAAVPAPREKPAAPPRRTKVAAVAAPATPAAVATPAPPREGPPTACLADLKAARVEFAALPAIASGSCGAETPLRVTKIDGIALQPPATLRCPTARAAADWVADGLRPAAQKLGSKPETIMVAASYSCRTRITGRGPSSRLSEHGKANALDVRAVRLADGREVSVMFPGHRDKALDTFQAEIRAAGCRTFKTVLGPGADPAHHDHLHFDLAERRRGGVVCR